MTVEDIEELFDRQTLLLRFGSKRQDKLAEQVLAMLSPKGGSPPVEIMGSELGQRRDIDVPGAGNRCGADSTRYARSAPIPVPKAQFAVSSADMRQSHPARTDSCSRVTSSSSIAPSPQSDERGSQVASSGQFTFHRQAEQVTFAQPSIGQLHPLPLEECFTDTTLGDEFPSLARARTAARRALHLATALDGRLPPFSNEDLSSGPASVRKNPGSVRAARAGIPQRLARESMLVLRKDISTVTFPLPAVAVEETKVVAPGTMQPLDSAPGLPNDVSQSVQAKAIETGTVPSPRQTRVYSVKENRKPNDGCLKLSEVVRWLSRGDSAKRVAGRGGTTGAGQSRRGRRDLGREREIMGGWG